MKLNKTYLFSFLFVVLLVSCRPEEEKLTLSPEILVQVLADVHIAEGAVLSIRPSDKDSIRDFYYHQIYEIHEINGNAFEHDIKVLKQNPKMMERIYEKVMQELDQRTKDLENNKEVKKKDKKEDKKNK